ncbi:DUF3298 and DUF4163 domain-containing protein [Rhodopseudomonas sp. P2A-2r]|uniref:DUF3298 and DUF4163 domain-containing protein n=1 Tax=unclassified Rhodopseudomonas TaxID=2638247 RepID=UPI002234701B|nr:DUF3298 and DUF4163 domain-containing protein [Rhodopseudomonas sp. P2A-2r]UZE47669.1 DUF3298 and DUF4163 domain-containing protein [Rhodopseudomonas sp. P2A-2r]
MSFLVRASLLLACFALAAPAFAAQPKPDFALKTKSLDASVILDKNVKADPALAANCLAEGKKWVATSRADADKERKATPDMFRNGAWTVERSYDTRSVVADRYVSIVRNDYTNTGGAHPNTDLDTILWDRRAAKRISIRPFFTETANNGPALTAIRNAVVAALTAEKKKRGIDPRADSDWAKGIEPNLLKLGAVTLAPSTEAGKSSGLTFHYPPDAVGSHVEGGYVAFVPWPVLKPYLSAEGVAIFGGDRPKGDDDEP